VDAREAVQPLNRERQPKAYVTTDRDLDWANFYSLAERHLRAVDEIYAATRSNFLLPRESNGFAHVSMIKTRPSCPDLALQMMHSPPVPMSNLDLQAGSEGRGAPRPPRRRPTRSSRGVREARRGHRAPQP